MRRVFVSCPIAATALAIAVSAALAGAGAQVVGVGVRGGPTPASIQIDAHGTGVHSAATGTARIATAAWDAKIRVTCIRSVGGRVLVGGLVMVTSAPAGPGQGAVIVIEDRRARLRDRVGFGFEPAPPTTSTDCSIDPATFPLRALTQGNFSVK